MSARHFRFFSHYVVIGGKISFRPAAVIMKGLKFDANGCLSVLGYSMVFGE